MQDWLVTAAPVVENSSEPVPHTPSASLTATDIKMSISKTILTQQLEMHVPSRPLFGSARSMYVKTSSVGPIVTFVNTGELGAAKVILYGFLPPVIRTPSASHVDTDFVIFATSVMFTEGAAGRHFESPSESPSSAICNFWCRMRRTADCI